MVQNGAKFKFQTITTIRLLTAGQTLHNSHNALGI